MLRLERIHQKIISFCVVDPPGNAQQVILCVSWHGNFSNPSQHSYVFFQEKVSKGAFVFIKESYQNKQPPSACLPPPPEGRRQKWSILLELFRQRLAQQVHREHGDGQQDQRFKSGSGVIINDKGYVLTNFHVVRGGRYYGVLLEEESNVFYTDRLVKYHPNYDLTVLQMKKRRRPIPSPSIWKGWSGDRRS